MKLSGKPGDYERKALHEDHLFPESKPHHDRYCWCKIKNESDLPSYALEQILEYAKYLEDNKQLSYELLKQRVETYKVKQ